MVVNAEILESALHLNGSRVNSLTLVVNSYQELFINLLLAWTINY